MQPVKQLWAPWRHAFVAGPRSTRCIFCAAKNPRLDRASHVVVRARHAFGMLNRYPYSTGHVLVAPYRHVARLEALRLQEWQDIWALAAELIKRLKREVRPHGLNVGMNLGRAAGAGIVGHLHLHIVPRWSGDTNFMPVLAGTKVMPQSLEQLFKVLRRRSASSQAAS